MTTFHTARRCLLLHVGPHKTGSTSIQVMLKRLREDLATNGYHYDDLGGNGAHVLADMLSANRFSEAQPLLEAIQPKEGTLILSSENFSRLNQDQAKRFLSAVNFEKIRVVYYLRNPLRRLHSQWCERVKHGYRHTFLEFLAARLARPVLDPIINDDILISTWSEVVGPANMDIHLYDRIDDVSSQFLRAYCDWKVSAEGKGDTHVNRSPDAMQIEIYRALAGYQWHLLHCRNFDTEIKMLRSKMQEVNERAEGRYLRSFSLSMDSFIMARLEKNLIRKHSPMIRSTLVNGTLYPERHVSWQYVAPEIWFENEGLTQELFALRREIDAHLGTPEFDLRLRAP